MARSYLISFLFCLTWTTVLGQTTSSWDRPNDKSLDGIDLTAYDCDDKCKELIAEGITSDRATYGDVPFDDGFYQTADNFSAKSSKPGDLLKLEPYINAAATWGLPGGATLYRMQYVSIGQDDKNVLATAFVVLPFTRRFDGKPFPVVAYAHGTIGTFYGCAPSSSYNLYDYDTWRQLYLSGYAVVGPDYAGLGNNYTAHHYLASTLAAKDTYYSVIAAKKAFGDLLSNQWASTGHSQGGGTVWALVESEYVGSGAPCNDSSPLDFVGGVAISPAPRIADIMSTAVRQNGSASAELCAYAPFLYAALEAVQPGSASGLLTPTMDKRIALGEKTGACYLSGGSLGLDLCSDGEVFSNFTSLLHYQPLYKFQSEYGAGQGKKSRAPMLVVQSDGDKIVPWTVTVQAWKSTCIAGGSPVGLSIYPALDHSATTGASSSEWLDWLRDRFDGKEWISECERRDYSAVDVAAAYLPSG